MKLSEVRKIFKHWQEKLKLQEWQVQVLWMTKAISEQFKDPDALVEWQSQYKTARVWVSKEAENFDRVLCHEAIHLRIQGHRDQKAEDTSDAVEFAINALSMALTGTSV